MYRDSARRGLLQHVYGTQSLCVCVCVCVCVGCIMCQSAMTCAVCDTMCKYVDYTYVVQVVWIVWTGKTYQFREIITRVSDRSVLIWVLYHEFSGQNHHSFEDVASWSNVMTEIRGLNFTSFPALHCCNNFQKTRSFVLAFFVSPEDIASLHFGRIMRWVICICF
jgi:hypothetical protein